MASTKEEGMVMGMEMETGIGMGMEIEMGIKTTNRETIRDEVNRGVKSRYN